MPGRLVQSAGRSLRRIPSFARTPDLPDDTRLWAALQAASGGPWAGCVYDVDRIIEVINAGLAAIDRQA